MTIIRDTSRSVYADKVLPSLTERQKVVYEALKTRDSFSNTELAHYLGWPINTITPRMGELRKMGLVMESGRRECKVTGITVHAWSVKSYEVKPVFKAKVDMGDLIIPRIKLQTNQRLF